MSEISKQALKVDNTTSFPNNTTGYISPTILRAFNVNVIDSTVNQAEYTLNSGSWNVSIGQLNTYTASFTPSFTGLNQFTASQLLINSGVNSFTQSANSSITQLNTQTASFYQYTSSINQIQSNGTVLGTSTRFNLVGPGTFFSASLTPNVNGPIATLTFTSDNAKTNTSSFNDYTASTNAWTASAKISISSLNTNSSSVNISIASLNTNSASVNTSISALNAFTASDNTSQAALNQFTASQLILNSGFATTASFNAYTSSQNALSGTFATTGSNEFKGNQTISGSLIQSSSNSIATPYGNSVGTYIKNRIEIAGGNGSDAPTSRVYVTGTDGASNTIARSFQNIDSTFAPGLGASYIGYADTSSAASLSLGVYDPNTGNGDTEFITNVDINGTTFSDWDRNASGYSTWLSLAPNLGNSPKPTMTRGLIITGSVYGNVLPITTSASTASIDLSIANYFTLTMTGTTKINVTNPQPGVTATLVINTSTGATSSFSSNVKQPSGSAYVASPSGNIDIISFTAVNSTTVYAFPAQSFV